MYVSIPRELNFVVVVVVVVVSSSLYSMGLVWDQNKSRSRILCGAG